MSVGGYIRRKLFWHNNPQLYADYLDILAILKGGGREKIDSYLSDLLHHAVQTTEFYQQALKGKSIKLSNFPVINKTVVIENRSAILSNAFEGVKLHVMHTSGSTGIPFEVSQDPRKRMRVIAEIKATNELIGYPSHEKMMYVLGDVARDPRRSGYSWKQQFCENIYRKSVAVSDDDTMRELVDFLIKNNIVAIHASGSSLLPLIEYILKLEENKIISTSDFKVRTVITGGEMIPAKLREDTERAFGSKCVCVVKYSNEEMGILAIDTGVGTNYKLNVADYYFEVLKMGSDEPVNEGEMGRLVITDLFNYATPLIRYDTGDLGIIKSSNGIWPELTEIEGKRRDLIFTPEGISIGGATITNLMRNAKNTYMWQLVQESEDTYCLKIVPIKGATPTEEDFLMPQLQQLLGENAKVRYEFNDEIPTTNSQKRRYTVNLYKPQ